MTITTSQLEALIADYDWLRTMVIESLKESGKTSLSEIDAESLIAEAFTKAESFLIDNEPDWGMVTQGGMFSIPDVEASLDEEQPPEGLLTPQETSNFQTEGLETSHERKMLDQARSEVTGRIESFFSRDLLEKVEERASLHSVFGEDSVSFNLQQGGQVRERLITRVGEALFYKSPGVEGAFAGTWYPLVGVCAFENSLINNAASCNHSTAPLFIKPCFLKSDAQTTADLTHSYYFEHKTEVDLTRFGNIESLIISALLAESKDGGLWSSQQTVDPELLQSLKKVFPSTFDLPAENKYFSYQALRKPLLKAAGLAEAVVDIAQITQYSQSILYKATTPKEVVRDLQHIKTCKLHESLSSAQELDFRISKTIADELIPALQRLLGRPAESIREQAAHLLDSQIISSMRTSWRHLEGAHHLGFLWSSKTEFDTSCEQTLKQLQNTYSVSMQHDADLSDSSHAGVGQSTSHDLKSVHEQKKPATDNPPTSSRQGP